MPYKDKEAQKARSRAYYLANRERAKKRQHDWYWTHKEEARVYNAQYRAKRREELNLREVRRYYGSAKNKRLLRLYELSEADMNTMIETQGGGCAICGGTRLLGVDHCHITGAVRGILCRKCNSGIGQLGDDAARVQKAADYLWLSIAEVKAVA